MDDSKVFMFPDAAKSSIDPALLMALNNNGFFLLKNRNFFFHSGKLNN